MRTKVIVECGHNFNGDLKLAGEMIREAKKAGAKTVKFQIYDTDKLGIKEKYGLEVYKDLKMSELTFADVRALKSVCDVVDMEFFASVFDVERVSWCEEINMNKYKIASRSIHDRELIDAICDTRKDVIASLGMWNEEGLPDINTSGNVDFLYCIANYPASFKEVNLPFFGDKYSGFSDHTVGILASLVAVSRGAKIIEKHFTLDKKMYGYDQRSSIEPYELSELIRKINLIEEILY